MQAFKKFLHKDADKAQKEIHGSPYLRWLEKFHYVGMWGFHQYSVAAGIAAGVFCAFIPLPLQMLLAAIMAILLRGNVLLAIAATWITNPITFIPINVFILKVGATITNTPPLIAEIHHGDFDIDWHNLSQSLDRVWENIKHLEYPLLIGSAVVASITAVLSFIIIYFVWGLLSRKHS